MGLSCGAKMSKIFLFIFNVIFFLFGVALLIVGIWIVVDKSKLVELAATALGNNNAISNQLNTRSTVEVGAYVLIGVGVFNFLVGFCGCCGACTENKCMLGIYAGLIGLIVILELVGVILAAVFRNSVEAKLQDGLLITLNASYVGLPKSTQTKYPVSLAWDFVMITAECCGLNGVKDFTDNSATNAYKWTQEGKVQIVNNKTVTTKIPFACCKYKSTTFVEKANWSAFSINRKNSNCGKEMIDYNNKGCYKAVKEKVLKYAIAIIAVTVAIMLIELLGIVLACCLIRAIDED